MSDPGAFREATRTVSVAYPVPFILVALLAFALSCLGLGIWADRPGAWVALLLGGAAAGLAFATVIYAIIWRPELLRSERHTLAHTYLQWLTSDDQDEAMRESASKVILSLAEQDVPKRSSRPSGNEDHG